MGYYLKKKLGCDDFTIVDLNGGAGGTWFSNTYPGCGRCSLLSPNSYRRVRTNFNDFVGCDVPSHFYSFSFALNPNWSRPLCEQNEILQCEFNQDNVVASNLALKPSLDLNDVVDNNNLRGHLTLSTKVIGATWLASLGVWEVELQNVRNGHTYKRRFRAVVSATGIFANPKWPNIKGLDTFQGAAWHTGNWDWSHDVTDKRVALVGNGCSGCQVIPAIAPKVKHLTHFARSKQWLFARVCESPLA